TRGWWNGARRWWRRRRRRTRCRWRCGWRYRSRGRVPILQCGPHPPLIGEALNTCERLVALPQPAEQVLFVADVAADAFEEAAEHVAGGFGGGDGVALAEQEEFVLHLFGEALVLEVLEAEGFDDGRIARGGGEFGKEQQ